jgi:hypothetical protein
MHCFFLRRDILVSLLLACPLSSQVLGQSPNLTDSDVIVLKNQDRISGQILSESAASIKLRSDVLGILMIPRDKTSEVRRHSKEINAPTGPVVAVASSPVPHPNNSVQVSLNAPETIVDGTQSQETLGGTVRLLMNQPDLCSPSSWQTALLISANHSRTWKVHSAAIVTDTFDGTLSVNDKAFGRTDWYLVSDFFGNSSIGVGLQQSYGGGLSTIFYSTTCPNKGNRNYVLDLTGDIGVRYVHQRLYAPSGLLNLAGIRPATNIVYTRLSRASDGTTKDLFSLKLSLWAMPTVNRIKAVQAGGSFQFSIPMTDTLSLSLGEDDVYINNAPKLRRKNYLKNSATLTYTFPSKPN